MAERSKPALGLVVLSGDVERVHYALAMAAAAAAVGRPTVLLFTMGGLKALAAGNGDGPGWHGLDPAADGATPAERDRALTAAGVAGFEELLVALPAMGAKLYACEMGMRAIGLGREDLRADVAVAEGGIVTFLAEAGPDGQIAVI